MTGQKIITASEDDRGVEVRLLLDEGVDVDLLNHDGSTALIQANLRGRYDIVKMLLEKGIQILTFKIRTVVRC